MSLAELSQRNNDGLTVTLYADLETKTCTVSVIGPEADFVLSEIPGKLALDVYRHPFAYGSRYLASGKLELNEAVA